ncbi:MAG: DoxX family protein, partial [Candidatus Acidiferrum sp.]
MKFLRSLQPLSLLLLRLVVGLIFLYHGYPKLVHPTEAMRQMFMAHGLPGYFVNVSAILECFGSVLLFLGLFTRPVALLLAIEMCVAIWKVHA